MRRKVARPSWRSRLAARWGWWRKDYDWPAYLEAMRRITRQQHHESTHRKEKKR